jgi:hypothetical protein
MPNLKWPGRMEQAINSEFRIQNLEFETAHRKVRGWVMARIPALTARSKMCMDD